MTALQVAILVALALIAGRMAKGRPLAILAVSVFAIFWLQPAEPFLSLRYWLPFATLGITVLSWALTASPEVRSWRENRPTVLLLLAAMLLAQSARYIQIENFPLRTAPAWPLAVAAMLCLLGLAYLPSLWQGALGPWRIVVICAIVGAFVVLKLPVFNNWLSTAMADIRGESSGAAMPLAWLGFSYLAFRLLHTIRDRQAGRLPPVTLGEYMNYALFFPAFTSGPIDRLERFTRDLRSPRPLCNEDWVEAGRRVVLGLFKKFVVADLLAVISINDVLVSKVQNGAWLWLFLYAYAFRIYFDFSGYTDLAIGMGMLLGVQLPENFASPYLKPNLSQFWNSWHMTLTQWFRSYIFNPMTRALRSLDHRLPAWIVVLAAQLTTMVLIGLWHGITWGFAAWGAWHAMGLFLHNRWTEATRGRMPGWAQTGGGQKLMASIGVFLTFNYVALGWLFFTLTNPAIAWHAMRRLFGFA